MKKVSILTPFKNAEKFIVETADSIFNQTYENWEWILINDHSIENEEHLLNKYLDDPRVHLLQNKGVGIIDTLITGLQYASGEYLTRMDADDIMPDKKLEWFTAFLAAGKSDIVTGKVQYFSNEGQISEGYKSYETWLNNRIDHQDFYAQIYRECSLASGNWLMRTTTLRECGGFDNLTYPEDYDLLFRWYQHDLNVLGIDQITHLWREHPLRTSRVSENYGQKQFFDLKIRRYIQHDLKSGPLILNGTGAKGKLTAKILIEKQIDFDWVSVEPEKFKSGIYGKQILPFDEITHSEPIQILNAAKIEHEVVQDLYSQKNKIQQIHTI
jgi:glycosyltransferase involved in cell wall biosynthesis